MLVHTSRQLFVSPINPPLGDYGRLMVLHDHTAMPEASVYYRTGHPPLLPMLLAPLVAVAGEQTWPLHCALFVFYLMSIFSLWHLLGLFFDKEYRFFGTLIWAVSPGLLINSHNIMWDTAIAGLMLLSFVTFLTALRRESAGLIFLAGTIAGLAAVTKVNALPLFLICPACLVFTRRYRLLAFWLLPAVLPPVAWAVHNLLVYGKIQYLSVGWYSFRPGDIRFRMERTASYFGGALMLPVFWYWLMIVRKKIRTLALCAALTGIWAVWLVIVKNQTVTYATSCALFAAPGIWLLYRSMLFGLGEKSGTFRPYEPALISAFCVLYFIVLNIMPSASMRYILPLVPFGVLVIGEELLRIPVRARKLFLVVALCAGTVFSLCLAVGDYLQCEGDRQLPGVLVQRGYAPGHTWYFGRLSYDYYLHNAGFRNFRAEHTIPPSGDYLIDKLVPSDYPAGYMISGYRDVVPLDTIRFYRWPLHTMGYGAGYYGNDRLPYSIRFNVPEKVYSVGSILDKQ
jgi:hypothetical protein